MRGKTTKICILCLILLIISNAFVAMLSVKMGMKYDFSDSGLFTLSDQTKELIDSIDNKDSICITVFSGKEDYDKTITEILDRYENYSNGKIKIDYIDPYENPRKIEDYISSGLDIQLKSVLISGKQRKIVAQTEEMYVKSGDNNAVEAIAAEQILSGALRYVESDIDCSVVFTAGHNEQVSEALRKLFVQNNYSIMDKSLSISNEVVFPSIMVTAAPTADFTSKEIEYIDTYLRNGGKWLVFTAAANNTLPNLYGYLEEWGIGVTNYIVAEKSLYTDSNPYSIVPIFGTHEITKYFNNNQLFLIMPSTCVLDQKFVSQNDKETRKILYSSDNSFIEDNEETICGPFAVAVTSEKENSGKMLVIGSKGIYSDSLMSSDANANAIFLAKAVDWLSEENDTINIPVKKINDAPIFITSGQTKALSFVFIVLLPAIVMIVGIIVCVKRYHS